MVCHFTVIASCTTYCAVLTSSARPRARRAHTTTGSPSSPVRVPQNSGVEGLGHALARADPRAALAAATNAVRQSAQQRSASSAAGAGGGGSPPPQRASTRRLLPLAHADACARSQAVGPSFVRSFGRSSLSSGRSPSRCAHGAAACGAALALLAPAWSTATTRLRSASAPLPLCILR